MSDPFAFLHGNKLYNDRTTDRGKPLDLSNVKSVVLHDRGGNYQGKSPYHLEVLPDGRIMNHWRANQSAPHAFKMNPHSLSVSYGGKVGATPTRAAMNSLRTVTDGLRKFNPAWTFESHGEAYNRTKGTPLQASRHGRGLQEAAWRKYLTQQPAQPVPGPSTQQPSLISGPTEVSSAGSSAAPVPVRAGEGQALTTAGAGAHTVPAVTSNQGGNTLEQKKPRSLMGGLLQGINSPGFLAGAVMLDSAARGGGIAQGAQMLQQSRSREEDLAYRKQRNEIADQYRQKTMEMQQQRMAQAGQPKTPWWVTEDGVDPRMMQYRQAGRPQTTTNVNVAGTKMESSFDKEVGKQYAKYYMAGQKGADTSRTALRNLEVMESALQDPNVYQGSGGETIQGLKKAAQTLFGVPVKGVGTGELIQRMAKKGALDMKGDLPGPLSNSDRDYLDSMQAGLGKSPEGNRQIVRMSMLQKKYHIARAQAARDFAAQNNGRFDQTKFGPFLEKIEGEYAQRFSQLIGQMRSEGEVPPRSPMAGIPTLRSAQEFMALPSGARFKAPDGSIRIKP